MEPKILTKVAARRTARHDRNYQWLTLEQIAEHDPLYICWWDKHGRFKNKEVPADTRVCGLISANTILSWLNAHPDWIVIGEWDDERYAAPVWITGAGREALENRHLYDMEPVAGGMIEPGWLCTPLEPGDPRLHPTEDQLQNEMRGDT